VKLFDDINSLAREDTSERQTKLITALLDNECVEMVQKMWQKDVKPKMLEDSQILPQHIDVSLKVRNFRHNFEL